MVAYRSSVTPSMVADLSVEIEGQEIVGGYEIFQLKAQTSADLNTWLEANGFRLLPLEALPIIEDYIDKKWYFVAVKLVREYEGVSTPHPLLIEFGTDQPVYPMKLTALNAEDLYLELFIIADQEAIPIAYDLSTEYCEIFELDQEDDASFFKNKYGPSYSDKQKIGHTDAPQIMWDGCVVTKLSGNIAGRKMVKDIFLGFKEATSHRTVVHSHASAKESAFLWSYAVFIVGFLLITVYYGGWHPSKLESQDEKFIILVKPMSFVVLICIIIGFGAYLLIGPKVNTVEVSREFRGEWQNFMDGFLDIDLDEIREFSDDELITLFDEENLINPFTNRSLIIEDSPGNITLDREDGKIVWMYFYDQYGSRL